MVVPLAICTMYTDKENNTHIKQFKYYMVDLTIGNIKCTYLFSQFNYKLLTKTIHCIFHKIGVTYISLSINYGIIDYNIFNHLL